MVRDKRVSWWVCGPSSLHLLIAETGDYPHITNGLQLLLAAWKKLAKDVSVCYDIKNSYISAWKYSHFCCHLHVSVNSVLKDYGIYGGHTVIWLLAEVLCIFSHVFFRADCLILWIREELKKSMRVVKLPSEKRVQIKPAAGYCPLSVPWASFTLSEMSGRVKLWDYSGNSTWFFTKMRFLIKCLHSTQSVLTLPNPLCPFLIMLSGTS